MSTEDDSRKRYFIGRPTKTRKTFVLVCYTLSDRKTRHYYKLPPHLKSQVESINIQYKHEVISFADAVVLLKDIIKKEAIKFNLKEVVLKNSTLSKVNQKLLNEFWDKVYGTRILSDEKSPKYDLQKALKLIEPLSLATATAKELQDKLKITSTNVNVHRRAVDRLNQMLRFLGRDIKLNKPPKAIRAVQHLTKDEFDRVLGFLPTGDLKDLATTLFGSGLRLSEALALTPEDFKGDFILVSKQLTKAGGIKYPKRGKVGRSVVLTFAQEATRRWCEVPDKGAYRYKIFDALIEACRRAFPSDKTKWVSPHDLRHSHAIYLLGKGASLTQVALNLRNRIDVCQEYYTGYAHSDETLQALKSLF